MGLPDLFVDNHWSVRQYPLHAISASEEPSGNEAFRVADARRSALDFATSITPNLEWILTCSMDQPRAITRVALDRGHNLAGFRIIYELSNDGFTTVETPFDIAALPANPGAGSLDDALGVVTEEGAWLKRFPVRYAKAERLRIPAMGTGLKPIVVGLWSGVSWIPPQVSLPTSDNQAQLVGAVEVSESGWLGAGRATRQRAGSLTFKLTSLFDYESARLHVEENWGRRRPMWITRDDAEAHRAVLALIDEQRAGFDYRTTGWFYPSCTIPYLEYQPLRD